MVVLNGALAGVAYLIGPIFDQLENLVIPPDIEEIVSGVFGMTTKELIFGAVNHILSTDKFAEELFKSVSVAELVFEGYHTGLLNILTDLDAVVLEVAKFLNITGSPTADDFLNFLQAILASFLGELSLTTEFHKLKDTIATLMATTPQISGGTFGIFKGKNATTADSYYLINSGKYERHNFMEIEEFNGKEKLPDEWWPFVAPTPTGQEAGVKGVCHEIYGTDGSQFPPFVDNGNRIWIYVAELCRWAPGDLSSLLGSDPLRSF